MSSKRRFRKKAYIETPKTQESAVDQISYLIQNYERKLTPTDDKKKEPQLKRKKTPRLKDVKILNTVLPDEKSSVVATIVPCRQGKHQTKKSSQIQQVRKFLEDSCDEIEEINSGDEGIEPEVIPLRDLENVQQPKHQP